MPKQPKPIDPFKDIDLTPYAGRWVAVIRGRITGVGLTEREAYLASKYQRPKEEPTVMFVPEKSTADQRPPTAKP